MTRQEVITTITNVRDTIADSVPLMAGELTKVLQSFDSMTATAAGILGSKGGNTPVKPGSRPRGRPRKNAISEVKPEEAL